MLDVDAALLFDEEEESEEGAGEDDESRDTDERPAGDRDGTSLAAEAANAEHISALREELVVGIRVEQPGEPIHFLNKRRLLKSRFSPFELGIHDGLAGYPDQADVEPAAAVMLRLEEKERSAAIGDWQARTEQHLDVLIVRREEAVELAEQRLGEAMYRLVKRHPRGAEAGFFDDKEQAAAATAEARIELQQARAHEPGPPEDPAPADGPPGEHDPPTGPATPPVTSPAKPPPPEPVKPTLEQQGVASRELVWSLRWYWFWIGTALLFAAEYPFLHAVVGQLLLERDPSATVQHLATVSVIVGFMIGTKLSGFLLRRAQSMFLLASLIQPERRPAAFRMWRWLGRRIRRRPDDAGDRQASNPTEEGLRFGAWSRLVGALLLAFVVVRGVLAIADYRSEAALSIAAQDQSDDFGTVTLPDGDATDPATPDEGDGGDDVQPIVPEGTLQGVFVMIALLNVICAIALAWAATEVPYDDVPSDVDDDAIPTDGPDTDGADGADGANDRRRRRKHAPRKRRGRPGEPLEKAVEARRKELSTARARLAEVIARRDGLDRRRAALERLSASQARLDQQAYWWANRASRRFEVEPEVDLRLAQKWGSTPAPVIDVRDGGGDS